MTLQQYIQQADLILNAFFLTGLIAIIVIAALLSLTAIAVVIYFHSTDYLQRRFGRKSK